MTDSQAITDAVRSKYSAIAEGKQPCCSSDCNDISTGYSAAELAALPMGANLGLGCGNPTALAELKPGETVIDLGSGAGIDCFLAAHRVGSSGRVIGIDMTEAMIHKARANVAKGGHTNVEFRLGQIEAMPVVDDSADVVISNCVINLSPDKARVFREIFRVLKPGGRFIVSDVVTKGQIPEEDRRDMEQWAGCVVGALEKHEYLAVVRQAGFVDLSVRAEVDYDYKKSDKYTLASMTLEARKP